MDDRSRFQKLLSFRCSGLECHDLAVEMTVLMMDNLCGLVLRNTFIIHWLRRLVLQTHFLRDLKLPGTNCSRFGPPALRRI